MLLSIRTSILSLVTVIFLAGFADLALSADNISPVPRANMKIGLRFTTLAAQLLTSAACT